MGRPARAVTTGSRSARRRIGVGRVGGGDDDVGRLELLRQPVEADAAAPDPGGELARRAHGAVGHHHLADPWRTSARAVASAIFPAPITSTEHPGRSSSTSSASSTATADTDVGPAAMRVSVRTCLPTSSACRNSRLSIGARGLLLGGELPRRAHLALDLALAHHHRVEAGGHPEELGRRAVVAQQVAGAGELVRGDLGVGHQAARHDVLGRAGIDGGGVDLGAVAGGERDHLGHGLLLAQLPKEGAHALVGQGGLLALLHRSGLVGEPEDQERHAGTPISSTIRASSRAPSSSPSARRRTTSVSISRSTASRRLGMSG